MYRLPKHCYVGTAHRRNRSTCWLGFPIPQISIPLSICGMCRTYMESMEAPLGNLQDLKDLTARQWKVESVINYSCSIGFWPLMTFFKESFQWISDFWPCFHVIVAFWYATDQITKSGIQLHDLRYFPSSCNTPILVPQKLLWNVNSSM